MIKLQCSRFDAGGIPVLSDAEIDRFAHSVLMDYKPGLLRKPGVINYAHFIESYMEANLQFHDIYNEDPKKPIFGMTIVEEGEVKVFDRDELCVKDIWVDDRTVLLDSFVMQEGKEGLALFTALHESGHLFFHAGDYEEVDDFYEPPDRVLCYRDDIEALTPRKRKSAVADWKEHQANCFAGCLAMPGATFLPFVRNLLHDHDVWKASVTTGQDEDTDYLAEIILPECIAETYGVSKAAAFIKLVKCGFVIDRKPRKLKV